MRTEVPVDTQEIELFTNHDQSELLLTLWTGRRSNFDADSYAVFFTKLQTEIPQLAGAAVVAAMGEKDEDRSPKPLLQWGRQNLRYRVAGRDYTVSLGSFFQVNATLLDGFVDAVIGGESGATRVGFICRRGAVFACSGRALRARSGGRIQSDCGQRFSQESARHTGRLRWFRYDGFPTKGDSGREPPPDLVLLDPPRAGAGPEACRLLAQCKARRIVYVSCDPATLGRDLAALIQSGYRLLSLQLVDMFPQTGHLETIAKLER